MSEQEQINKIKEDADLIPEIDSPFLQKETNRFNPQEYSVMKQIGWGNFSDIYLVEHKKEKKLMVMKVFEANKVERLRKQRDVLMEKHVMLKVKEHEYLIKYYSSFKDDMYLYLSYEYINGGDLWSRCIYYGICHSLVLYFFKQILLGIKHLHDSKIIHRDIKVIY